MFKKVKYILINIFNALLSDYFIPTFNKVLNY